MQGLRSFLVLVAVAFAATHASSAERQGPSDTGLVYLRVTATDSGGRFTVGLGERHFKISEDNAPQTVAYLSANGTPIRVRVVVDGSREWREQARALASSAFEQSRIRIDEVFIDESPDLSPTEAVFQAVNRLLQSGDDARRAVVLLTDRRDPGVYSFSKVKELLKDQDIQLHVIALSEPSDSPIERGRAVLTDLAVSSGGKAYFAPSISLAQVGQNIARDLHYQYVIGYRPTNAVKDGKWRKVKITAEVLDPKTKKTQKLNIRSKPGYYATAGSTK
ncbi:MAG TPA: hypothetical protein VFE29_00695 [Terriglobia bacterium]|nr:hypothetical protein [Terriglobia bacterium]